jgi:hypothetical protein
MLSDPAPRRVEAIDSKGVPAEASHLHRHDAHTDRARRPSGPGHDPARSRKRHAGLVGLLRRSRLLRRGHDTDRRDCPPSRGYGEDLCTDLGEQLEHLGRRSQGSRAHPHRRLQLPFDRALLPVRSSGKVPCSVCAQRDVRAHRGRAEDAAGPERSGRERVEDNLPHLLHVSPAGRHLTPCRCQLLVTGLDTPALAG